MNFDHELGLNAGSLIKQAISDDAPFGVNLFILPPPPTHTSQLALSTQLAPIRQTLQKYYDELEVAQPARYEQYGENFADQFAAVIRNKVLFLMKYRQPRCK